MRDRASDQERFYIDFSYYRLVTGDLEKAARICELWAQSYPRDMLPHGFLGSSTSTALGKFEKAAEESKKAIELDPDHPFLYANLAASQLYRNQLAAAQGTLQRASDRKLDVPELLAVRYQIAFLKGDEPEMERLATRAQAIRELEGWVLRPAGFCSGLFRPLEAGKEYVTARGGPGAGGGTSRSGC